MTIRISPQTPMTITNSATSAIWLRQLVVLEICFGSRPFRLTRILACSCCARMRSAVSLSPHDIQDCHSVYGVRLITMYRTRRKYFTRSSVMSGSPVCDAWVLSAYWLLSLLRVASWASFKLKILGNSEIQVQDLRPSFAEISFNQFTKSNTVAMEGHSPIFPQSKLPASLLPKTGNVQYV